MWLWRSQRGLCPYSIFLFSQGIGECRDKPLVQRKKKECYINRGWTTQLTTSWQKQHIHCTQWGICGLCTFIFKKRAWCWEKYQSHDQLLRFIRLHYNCLFIISENNFRRCFIAYTVFSTHPFICGGLP